jgi:beta-N-acetylhexosaminidase
VSEFGAAARGVIAAGFDGERFDASLPQFGAYVLFARNASSLPQVRALTDALRAHASDGAPALIAVDQEGGRVARLRDGAQAMPSMMALGAVDDADLARRAGEQTAFDLRRAGCTLNFAPVLDLALYPDNTVIGTRSLGSQPQAVARLGGAFGEGLWAGGVLPCFKHFPGHGASPIDSHVTLPAIDAPAEVLRGRDLIPFAAVAKRAPAIMGTHAVVLALDSQRPAILSPRIATALLRDELGFEGVFVTDCLQMGALTQCGDPAANAVAALTAGADLLTVSHGVDVALEIAAALERAVGDGRLSAARLREAYARVLRLREAASAPPDDDVAPHPGVGREIARRAITLVRGFARTDPTASTAVSFEGGISEGVNVRAVPVASLRHEAPALEELRLPLDPSDDALEAALREVAANRKRPLVLARRAHLYPRQAAAIERIVAEYPDAVVISMLEPYDVPLFARAATVLAAYGDDSAAVGGIADVLFGGSRPEGLLPVALQA